MVNAEKLQGSWNQIRGKVKEQWGTLTDDDLMLRNGNVDQLVGRIQQKTGVAREQVESFLNNLTGAGSSAVSQAAQAVGQYADQASHRLREQVGSIPDQYQASIDEARRYVRSNPGQSAAAILGVGIGLGLLMGLALRSR